MTDVAIIFVGLAAIIGAVVYVLRSRVHWELDGLRKDLSSDGMSATERDAKAAAALQEELCATFPGLRVELRPLAAMMAGEEGCPGSYEVVWEGRHWRHSRVLHSRLATGAMPPSSAVSRAVLHLLLGGGTSAAALRTAPRARDLPFAAPPDAVAARRHRVHRPGRPPRRLSPVPAYPRAAPSTPSPSAGS